MAIEDTLMKMSKEIEEGKSRKSRLEGELHGLMGQLKKYNYGSVDEAKVALGTLDKEISTLTTDLEGNVDKLRKAHNWKTL